MIGDNLEKLGIKLAQRWMDWISCQEFALLIKASLLDLNNLELMIVSMLSMDNANFKIIKQKWAQKQRDFLKIRTQLKKKTKKFKKKVQQTMKKIKNSFQKTKNDDIKEENMSENNESNDELTDDDNDNENESEREEEEQGGQEEEEEVMSEDSLIDFKNFNKAKLKSEKIYTNFFEQIKSQFQQFKGVLDPSTIIEKFS